MSPAPADESDHKPLDGGWGWMVVVAAHISIGFAYSTPKVLSIFYNEIQENLGASSSEIAWISSIMLAAMYAGGPVSGMLVTRFGSRPIVMAGGLMCGVSMVTATFGNSMVYLYLCIGIIGGCGLSLNLNTSLTIISKYFLVKRPLANGLVMAGSPVFTVVLAPLNQYLLNRYGWRGSFLIFGGLMLNCCVAGALMRPVIARCKTSNCAPQKNVEDEPNESNTKLKESCMKSAMSFFDWTFFKDRGFVIYLVGSIMFIFGAYAPILFLSAYAIDQGVDEFSAANLLTFMALADMFVRPATGLIASSKRVRPRIQYFFSFAMVFTGTVHLLCPMITMFKSYSYTFLVIYTVFFGIGFGMVFALIFECLMDLMGKERFPSAFGVVTMIECIPLLLGPPVAGLLVDIFGDYKYLFFMCGTVILTGGLFLFVMNIYNYHMLEKEKPGKDGAQNQMNVESQEHVSALEVEMKHTPEAEMERSEPEAK